MTFVRLFIVCLAIFPVAAVSQALAEEQGESEDAGTEINGEGTVVYDQEFFARFPNAVTAADLVTRIPGGQQALNGSGDNSRGFSRNRDNILINGKRLSGKSNDSRSALMRISADQVERIEVIRGSSPDIKVSSTQAIFNIITNEEGSGAGSWEAMALIQMNGDVQPGGRVSYGASKDGFEYFVSFSRDPYSRTPVQRDRLFDGTGAFTNQIDETAFVNRAGMEFTANLGYTFDNGDQVHLNGQYERYKDYRHWNGDLYDSDGMGGLVFTGNSFRREDNFSPEYEIGGDITKGIGDNWSLKLIGLFNHDIVSYVQSEDFDITGGVVAEDVLSIESKTATEAIGRVSATWTPNGKHSLEVGSEMANNRLESGFQYFERDGGVLVPQDVAGANTVVKEIRNESFFIHTWQINTEASLETSLFTEWSRISQSGDLNNSRTFFFFRPSFDFRYNLSERDQLLVSIRRRIGQLDFEDFATSISKDDEIVGGNPDLKPWKRWEFEIGYEHRFTEDKGFYKVRLVYYDVQDTVENIEISPGITGVGNVGHSILYAVAFDGSYRFSQIGLKNLVISVEGRLRHVRLHDGITGEWRRPDWAQSSSLRLELRHDVRPLKFSWGINLNRDAEETYHDVNEVIVVNAPRYWMDLFIEKQLFKGVVFRAEWANAANPNNGRFRSFYEDGRVGGVLTQSEIRRLKYGRRVFLSLKGTF